MLSVMCVLGRESNVSFQKLPDVKSNTLTVFFLANKIWNRRFKSNIIKIFIFEGLMNLSGVCLSLSSLAFKLGFLWFFN